MTTIDPALSVSAVSRTFSNGHKAVDAISFEVSRGAIFGFIGLNGAGKTTTIRMIAGLDHPDAGVIRLFGKELDPSDPDMRRRVGYVLDEPMYFEWMPAGDYLRFVGVMEGLPAATVEARVEELLRFFDLDVKGNESIESFSTGMKKKVSLAAAIIHTPDLVILDEPLEGIDALAQNSIKEALGIMARRGATILITSHVLDTVEKLCSTIAIVHQGRIVRECSTEGLGSLEQIFIETVAGTSPKKQISFLNG
jgi:ABC-2 type transport system ATP-binding protein